VERIAALEDRDAAKESGRDEKASGSGESSEAGEGSSFKMGANSSPCAGDPESAVASTSEETLAAEAASLLTREVRSAPTLVKYAQPNSYEVETRAELALAANEILSGLPHAVAPVVDLVERTESLEAELAATLLYSVSHHPYRQIRDLAASFPEARIAEIVDLGLRHRGRHDEALRAFHAVRIATNVARLMPAAVLSMRDTRMQLPLTWPTLSSTRSTEKRSGPLTIVKRARV